MRKTIKDAVGDTVKDLIKSGIKTSFSERELKVLGVKIPQVEINAQDIQEIRQKIKLSQSVFAKLLNVSLSSVRQWEQGNRMPSGSTKVLLDLLHKQPDVLNYRLRKSNKKRSRVKV